MKKINNSFIFKVIMICALIYGILTFATNSVSYILKYSDYGYGNMTYDEYVEARAEEHMKSWFDGNFTGESRVIFDDVDDYMAFTENFNEKYDFAEEEKYSFLVTEINGKEVDVDIPESVFYYEDFVIVGGYMLGETVYYGQVSDYVTSEIMQNDENIIGSTLIGKNGEVFEFVNSDFTLEVIKAPDDLVMLKVAMMQSKDNIEEYSSTIEREWVQNAYENSANAGVNIVISIVMMLVSLMSLCFSAGRKNGINGVYLNEFDQIPFEILLVLDGIFLGLVYLFIEIMSVSMFSVLLGISLVSLVQIILFISFIARVKGRTWFTSTLIYKIICKPLKRLFGAVNKKVLKTPIVIRVIVSMVFVQIAMYAMIASEFTVGAVVLFLILCIMFVLTYAYISILKNSVDKMAAGDLEYKTDTKSLHLDFKQFGNSLNQISDGLDIAIQGKIKSERMKAELITNVSHDIKTPLTSIINYVDLLKKEDDNDKKTEYIEVLERQSQKLKFLITDLVEASKISSGNISVNAETLNLSVIATQIEGEYIEKMTENSLELIVTPPKEQAFIKVDSNHLNRILDNLIGNALKYSATGTRVYIDVNSEDLSISIKNISKNSLNNITADELTERFVRGDKSRNTDGNGLGLSIAESLAKAINADLEIIIDGDLFKVNLYFEKADEEIQEEIQIENV